MFPNSAVRPVDVFGCMICGWASRQNLVSDPHYPVGTAIFVLPEMMASLQIHVTLHQPRNYPRSRPGDVIFDASFQKSSHKLRRAFAETR